jgi:hypothetical protein
MHIPQAFVAKLNALRENGALLYRAAEGSWRSLVARSGVSNFNGTMDVQVEILDLKKHLEQRERRERERLTRARKL